MANWFLRVSCALAVVVLVSNGVFAKATKIVTAKQVNGTWENKSGSIKIWALGKQKLQVEYAGFYEYESADGLMANTGEGKGIALITGDTAVFKPEDAEEECKITMTFKNASLIVEQEGVCGFGLNVSAAGKYHKTSNKKPKFGDQ